MVEMIEPIAFDAAFDLLVEHLRPWANVDRSRAKTNANHNCDVWLPDLAGTLVGEAVILDPQTQDKKEALVEVLADAATELVRIGVLRPGEARPDGTGFGRWVGEGFSLTRQGRAWILDRPPGPSRDPGKFIETLRPFASKFGAGFLQRSQEAIGCWRTGHYLASCVMCGGAAESILLAAAVAKHRSEEKALALYRGSGGRKKITELVANALKVSLKEKFESLVALILFWRDEAGHGRATAISEPEANLSLIQLLRFAQFSDENWSDLTQ